MNLERKYISLADFKQSEDGNGGFTGYASTFGELDSVDDIVISGAYLETLSNFLRDGWIAADHTWGVKDDLGIVASASEDDNGLLITAEFHPTPDAQAVREKIKNRLSKGKSVKLSIGYIPTDFEYVSGKDAVIYLRNQSSELVAQVEAKSRVRLLKSIKLFEVSLVSVPALHSASVAAAKALAEETFNSEPHAGLTFKEHSESVLATVAEFISRATSLNQLRVKEGRTLSAVNRDRLKTLHQRISELMTDLDALLTETEPKQVHQNAPPSELARLLAEFEHTKLNLQPDYRSNKYVPSYKSSERDTGEASCAR